MAGNRAGGFPPDLTTTLRLAQDLYHNRRTRDSLGLYVVEGVRNVVTAIDQAAPIHTIIYSERLDEYC